MSRLAERSEATKRPRVLGSTQQRGEPAQPAGSGFDPNARLALTAIVAVMGLQVLFLLVGCDWDLCGDEAEYWEWSRRLDWSYFTRGPLIAWVIRLGTELFGYTSLALTGSMMFAVRLPAVLLGGLTGWGTFRLAELTTGSRRAALLATLLLPAIPVFAVGGVIITSDTPLVCCWIWAAVWALRAIRSGDLRLWALAGIIGALGVMAKYTVLAFPASVGLYLLLSPRNRDQWFRRGFWTMSALCVIVGMAPIVIWNAQHGWAGAGQLADRVGLSSRATWGTIVPVLSFLGGEVAVLGGIWWVAGVSTLIAAIRDVLRANGAGASSLDERPNAARDGTLYLLCLWGVVWCACLAASLLGETEANWMAPGYIPLVVLIGRRMDGIFARGGNRARVYVAAWCVSIAGVVAIHHTDWFYPIVARYVPAPTARWAAPLRLIDVTARLRGHQPLARAVARHIQALRAEGASPFVVTPTYALTSTLAFYLPGQPETYCLGWNYGMTGQPVNQHDLWHPNPRHDPGPFRGRPVIVVEDANMPPSYATHLLHKGVVSTAEPVERIDVRERGVTVGSWDITVCRDYRGVAGYGGNPPMTPEELRPARARRLRKQQQHSQRPASST